MSAKAAIVCVDDEKVVLDSLQEQLELAYGDRVLVEIAESADEAMELIQDLIDEGYELVLVISDWLMPKIKGDKFLIDVHSAYPEALKIMLTGQADIEAVENAKENANLFAYMKKPWRMEDLVATINSGFQRLDILT